jgi:hypothetical protein
MKSENARWARMSQTFAIKVVLAHLAKKVTVFQKK